MIKVASTSGAAVFLLVGCRIVDGYYPESTYRLHIQAQNPSAYSVRLSTDTSTGTVLNSDGRIEVTVPGEMWGQKRLGNVPLTRASPMPDIEILVEGHVVRQLRLALVDKLPLDTFGYSIVELK